MIGRTTTSGVNPLRLTPNTFNCLIVSVFIAFLTTYAYCGSKAPEVPSTTQTTAEAANEPTDDKSVTPLQSDVKSSGSLCVGDSLPHINMFDLYGNGFDSHKLLAQGKHIIVSFFTTYCKPCIDEFPDFKRIVKDSNGSVLVLMVNVGQDDRNQLKTFCRTHELINFTVIRDKYGYIRKPFGIDEKVPVTFLSDPNGIIIHAQYGSFPETNVWETLQPLIKSENK